MPECLIGGDLRNSFFKVVRSSSESRLYAKSCWALFSQRAWRTPTGFYSFLPCRAGRGAGAQYADLQAGLVGAGGRWADPAGASGDRNAE